MTWQEYTPAHTSRRREEIEWSIHYAYNATDTEKPRVLLIGDSICNGYQNAVRQRLDGVINVSFWASSKCVTDPDYFRELEFILDYIPCSMICFNNGLHSLFANRDEWISAYRAAVSFIRAKCPGAQLSLTLSTPLKDPELTEISAQLNEIVAAIAAEAHLPVIDMFTPMDGLDREKFWTDTYHFTDEAKAIQANVIAAHLLTISQTSFSLGGYVLIGKSTSGRLSERAVPAMFDSKDYYSYCLKDGRRYALHYQLCNSGEGAYVMEIPDAEWPDPLPAPHEYIEAHRKAPIINVNISNEELAAFRKRFLY